MPKHRRKSGGMLKLLACTETLSMDDEDLTQFNEEGCFLRNNRTHDDGPIIDGDRSRTKDGFLRKALNSLLNDKGSENLKIVSSTRTGRRLADAPAEATTGPPAAAGRSVSRNLRKRLIVALLEDSGQLSPASGRINRGSRRTAEAAADIRKLLRQLNDVIDDYSGSSSSGVGSNNTSSSSRDCSGCCASGGDGGCCELPQSSLPHESQFGIDERPPPLPPPRRLQIDLPPSSLPRNAVYECTDLNAVAPTNNRIIKQSDFQQQTCCSWSADVVDEDPQCSATVVARPIVPVTTVQQVSIGNNRTAKDLILKQGTETTNNICTTNDTNATSTKMQNSNRAVQGSTKTRREVDKNKTELGPSSSSHHRRGRPHRGFRRYRCAQPQAASNYYANNNTTQAVSQSATVALPAPMAMTSSSSCVVRNGCCDGPTRCCCRCRRCCCCCGPCGVVGTGGGHHDLRQDVEHLMGGSR
uniref:WAP domain-containing protein n=1 Tax=Macrostomum lignano TaxID=282301 RepID=A0A1I8GKH1_9PLAT